MNQTNATAARCATCRGRIELRALQYNGQSVGSAWIHVGAANAQRALIDQPHSAVGPDAASSSRKGRKVQMATNIARKPAAKPARTAAAAPAAKVTKRAPKAAPKPVRGEKSAQMREMFADGASVSEVAKAVGAHYSFAHGVYRRMVEAGDLEDGAATTPREPKAAKAKSKAKVAAKPAAKPAAKATPAKPGRPTAARRAANRATKPEPEEILEDEEIEDEDFLDEDEDEEEDEE